MPLGVSEELEGSRRYVCRDGERNESKEGPGWKGSLYARQSSLDFVFPFTRSALRVEVKLSVSTESLDDRDSVVLQVVVQG